MPGSGQASSGLPGLPTAHSRPRCWRGDFGSWQGAWLGHRRARSHFALPPSLPAALSPAGLPGKQARGNVAAARFPAALAMAGSEGWQRAHTFPARWRHAGAAQVMCPPTQMVYNHLTCILCFTPPLLGSNSSSPVLPTRITSGESSPPSHPPQLLSPCCQPQWGANHEGRGLWRWLGFPHLICCGQARLGGRGSLSFPASVRLVNSCHMVSSSHALVPVCISFSAVCLDLGSQRNLEKTNSQVDKSLGKGCA